MWWTTRCHRKYPQDTYCTDRADPRSSLALCIIKCRFNFCLKIWHLRDSNPGAFSVKEMFLFDGERHVGLEDRSQARYQLRHGGEPTAKVVLVVWIRDVELLDTARSA